tara:strand:+ start:2986 stop:3348 length:363 start_codon:yes stop_codon:yes gene_type:complete
MEEMIDKFWYETLDWSMIWVCLAAIITLSLFIALNPKKIDLEKKGVSNYFVNTWKNHAYNLFAGFVMLSFVSEVGFPFVNYFMNLSIDVADGTLHFLAAISGLGGGYVIAKFIRIFQKIA